MTNDRNCKIISYIIKLKFITCIIFMFSSEILNIFVYCLSEIKIDFLFDGIIAQRWQAFYNIYVWYSYNPSCINNENKGNLKITFNLIK